MRVALASRAPSLHLRTNPKMLRRAATRALAAAARGEHATACALATGPRGEHAKAVVVGGGVSGLTCALRLLERGFDVRVVARERFPETVSIGAGAIWEYPRARPCCVGCCAACALTHTLPVSRQQRSR
jgi:heterodisulfide reductase subunit A-like polyferredoxin